jgi:tetratricopeptide (TPR) repeat protein
MKRDFNNHLYLGNHYKELKSYEKAEHHYMIAKSIAPNDSEVLNHLCSFCHHMFKFDLAFKCAELAVSNLKKPNEVIYLNYALLLGDIGETEKSQKYFCKAIETNPKYNHAIFGLGMEQIRNGNFIQGWQNYEYRMSCFDHLKLIKEKYKVPYWNGCSQKKVVFYGDQGLGDIIFGLRYLPELILNNTKFYIDNNYDLSTVFTENTYQNQEIDYCCSFMSLPYLINPENSLSENYKLYFKQHDTKNTKKKIGIIFAGNPEHNNDYKRSMQLSQLKPIFEKHDCYLLQKLEHMKRWHMSKFVNLYDCEFKGTLVEIDSLKNTMEKLYELDCLVTVDTGLAHLAGAIGMPTYVLLDYSPDFRWGMSSQTTPYYPSWTLCRQTMPFDWNSVIQKCLNFLG